MTALKGLPGVAVIAMLLLGACVTTQYRFAGPGVHPIGKMRITIGYGWQWAPDEQMPEKRPGMRVLSRNKLEQDRLISVGGIDPGGTVFKADAVPGQTPFEAGMDPEAIADMVAESIEVALWEGDAQVEARNVRAHGFTGIPGFRFDLEADIPGAPDQHGIAGGFVVEDRLYLNVFLAEWPGTYERHTDVAEEVIDSAVLAVRTIGRP